MVPPACQAKRQPNFRFYAWYDRVYHLDVLQAAWRRVRANQGALGVDGLSLEAVATSAGGVEGFLAAIQRSLQDQNHFFDSALALLSRFSGVDDGPVMGYDGGEFG